jgi:predicted O-methyltransferase YrrM
VSARARWRRLRLGLPTILGLARRGYFIPHRYAAALPAPQRYDALAPLFAAAEPAMREWLARASAYRDAFAAIGAGRPPAPRWNQSWFPGLDAALAYTILRERKFGRVVEVGSGHSTRFMARAIADGVLGTRLTAIDPAPRADLAGLAIDLQRTTLQDCGIAPFEGLTAADAVFIDSSHILMPGTDVDLLFGAVLPRLAQGALVHVHDIVLPDAYPPDWEWRGYNEQNALAPLIALGALRILWSSSWARAQLGEAIAQSGLNELPVPEDARETSLWLAKA